MPPSKLIRKLSIALVVLLVARRLFNSGVVRYIRWLFKTHKKLLQLPTPTSLPEHPVFGQLMGPSFFPRGELEYSGLVPDVGDALRVAAKHLVNGLTNACRVEEMKDAGIVAVWAVNSKLNPYIPNSTPVIIVKDIEIARQMLSAKEMANYKKGGAYTISHDLVGDSVLSTAGFKWSHQRKVLDRGFKHVLLRNSMPNVSKTADELISQWSKAAAHNKPVNVHEEMLKLTIDVLGRVAFSSDFGSVLAPTTRDAPLYDAFNTILNILQHRCMVPLFHHLRKLPTETNRKFDRCIKRLDGHVDFLIRQRIRERTMEPDGGKSRDTNPVDLLDMFLIGSSLEADEQGNIITKNNKKPGEEPDEACLTFQEVLDDIKTMLFAGHDTTGAALTWLLHLLVQNPDILKRVRDEYESVIGEHGELDYDMLEDLPVLNACVMETLRLYPSAAFTRESNGDQKLGPYEIPGGVEILLMPYAIQRDPKYYDDPDNFIPDRWLQGNRPRKNSNTRSASLQTGFGVEGKNHALLPFSLGPRNCVGRPLALMEIRVVIIKLLQEFDFVPANEVDEVPLFCLTLNPKLVQLVPVARK